MYEDNTVEAIEEGKIVKVPESYARREGLPILRRSLSQTYQQKIPSYLEKKERPKTESRIDFMSKLKKSPTWKEKQVLSELINNWQWHIRTERRKKGITRKQLAELVNETESNIKMLEFGCLPSEDFVLINKVQKVLGINLRKDQKDFNQSLQDMMQSKEPTKVKTNQSADELLGKDIDILDKEF